MDEGAGCECVEVGVRLSVQATELQPIHFTPVSVKRGQVTAIMLAMPWASSLGVKSGCQTQPLPLPGIPPPPASPSYQRLLVLIGFDAADKVGLAVGQDPHQLLQRLLELAPEGDGALGGV